MSRTLCLGCCRLLAQRVSVASKTSKAQQAASTVCLNFRWILAMVLSLSPPLLLLALLLLCTWGTMTGVATLRSSHMRPQKLLPLPPLLLLLMMLMLLMEVIVMMQQQQSK